MRLYRSYHPPWLPVITLFWGLASSLPDGEPPLSPATVITPPVQALRTEAQQRRLQESDGQGRELIKLRAAGKKVELPVLGIAYSGVAAGLGFILLRTGFFGG